MKKAIIAALIALPLAGCVSVPEHNDRGYSDNRNYDYRRDGPSSATIDAVQNQQQRQIQAARRTGEITAAEERRLQLEQQSIRNQETAYKADGRLTEREREQ